MTAALAFALLAQAPAPASLPVGTSPEFAKAALAVESHLVEGDVAGAREAAKALPIRTPRLTWKDEASLPPALRGEREKAFATALRAWSFLVKGFAPSAGGGEPGMTIGFSPLLPEGADGLPAAIAVDSLWPLQAKVGLQRGKPGVELRPAEMFQQFAYAIGRYLGVPDAPFVATAMHQDARPGLFTFPPNGAEVVLASQNLDLADRLRAAVEAGKPLGLALPVVKLTQTKIDLGSTRQGTPLPVKLDVENEGAGTMEYRLVPDCNCFVAPPPGTIPAMGRKSLELRINTDQYIGRIDKALLFLSNDPSRPSIEIPVTFFSRPAYRFFHPGGEQVVLPDTGGTYDFFLYSPEDAPITPISVRWDGADGKVTWAPWSGVLADPDLNEGAQPRKGFRFRLRVSKDQLPGQTPGTLTIQTDSATFPTIMANLSVQKGIVALTDPVPLGDMTDGATASYLVSRPNQPFKVLGVDAGPLMKATWKDVRGGWEYRIDLAYKGGASKGDFVVPVRVRTDDPKQPTIETLARGIVR